MKIGSLFDGSGGFPLAATMCGITPVWASEVEPFPIAVTRSRFPNMKHLGSVIDVKGNEVEPVDVITFGSPCQDLSVAGKRAGLKHTENGDDETTRSGLFMEAIRIIKEMREATNGVYPRIAVWENVPGAFSSNKGEDFRIVLEEFIKIVEPTATMPSVPKNGWPYSDVYCGDGWSLAYRVLDAQYWGVPQRRRRIYLVADFRGQRAGKISFEREGLRGYFTQSGAQREGSAGDAESGIRTADYGECVTISSKQQSLVTSRGLANTLGANDYKEPQTIAYTVEPGIADREGGHIYEGESGTLRTEAGDNRMAVAYMEPIAVATQQGGAEISENGICPTVTAAAGMSGNNQPWVTYSVENHPADSRVNIDDSGKVQTLTSRMGTGGGNVPMVMEPIAYNGENITSPLNKANPQPGDPCHTLGTDSRNYLVYCLQGNGIGRADTAGCSGRGWNDEACYTLNTIDRPAVVFEQPVVLDRAFFNQGQNALYDPQCYEDGTVPTLVAKGPSAVAYWDGGQTCGTLTANNAGGSQRMPDKDNFNCVIETRNTDAVYVDTSHADDVVRVADTVSALQSRDYKGGKLVATRYIVRRLTPTECARLQGFPDDWAHPDTKDALTDEEYAFWLDVRNTHAAINDKAVKDYTRDQMLTWYNKLHTDSAEYKLWGNGIALPCALYVMQGIAEGLHEN